MKRTESRNPMFSAFKKYLMDKEGYRTKELNRVNPPTHRNIAVFSGLDATPVETFIFNPQAAL